MKKRVKDAADLLERLAAYLAGGLLFAALISITAQIFFRYVLRNSLSWSEEFARYALIFATMVGSAVAYRRGSHVAMTMLVERLPMAWATLVWRLTHVGVIAFCLLLFTQGWMLAMRNLARQQTSPALQIEIGWVYMAIPIGAVLIMASAIEALFEKPDYTVAAEDSLS